MHHSLSAVPRKTIGHTRPFRTSRGSGRFSDFRKSPIPKSLPGLVRGALPRLGVPRDATTSPCLIVVSGNVLEIFQDMRTQK